MGDEGQQLRSGLTPDVPVLDEYKRLREKLLGALTQAISQPLDAHVSAQLSRELLQLERRMDELWQEYKLAYWKLELDNQKLRDERNELRENQYDDDYMDKKKGRIKAHLKAIANDLLDLGSERHDEVCSDDECWACQGSGIYDYEHPKFN